jgi:hypothetical protein
VRGKVLPAYFLNLSSGQEASFNIGDPSFFLAVGHAKIEGMNNGSGLGGLNEERADGW